MGKEHKGTDGKRGKRVRRWKGKGGKRKEGKEEGKEWEGKGLSSILTLLFTLSALRACLNWPVFITDNTNSNNSSPVRQHS